MITREYIGRSVEEAIEAGLAELGVAREDAQISVIDEGSRGFFGLFGFKMARVAISAEVEAPVAQPVAEEEPEAEMPAEPVEAEEAPVEAVEDDFEATPEEELSEEARRVSAFLRDTIRLMGNKHAEVQIAEEEETITLRVGGGKVGRLIGHRGETLDALQLLCGLVANHHQGKTVEPYRRVSLDIGDYRREREDTLRQLARRLAGKVRRTGEAASLEPMNSFERRIIHSELSEVRGVSTASEGEEPNRYVVILPADED